MCSTQKHWVDIQVWRCFCEPDICGYQIDSFVQNQVIPDEVRIIKDMWISRHLLLWQLGWSWDADYYHFLWLYLIILLLKKKKVLYIFFSNKWNQLIDLIFKLYWHIPVLEMWCAGVFFFFNLCVLKFVYCGDGLMFVCILECNLTSSSH